MLGFEHGFKLNKFRRARGSRRLRPFDDRKSKVYLHEKYCNYSVFLDFLLRKQFQIYYLQFWIMRSKREETFEISSFRVLYALLLSTSLPWNERAIVLTQTWPLVCAGNRAMFSFTIKLLVKYNSIKY